jgi:hypothetical protein
MVKRKNETVIALLLWWALLAVTVVLGVVLFR